VITFGIDRMVDMLILLNLSVADTAKTAEQMMAVGGLIVTGVVAGAVFFAAMRAVKRPGVIPGLILGLIVGVPVAAISASVNRTATTPTLVSTIWIVAAFLAWGAAVGWAYARLSAEPRTTADAAEGLTIEQISRRQFLVRMGAASAAITVVGAGLGAVLSAGSRREQALTAAVPVAESGPVGPPPTFPNADDPLVPAPGTRPEYTPLDEHYRIDINVDPPVVDGATWTLPITGLVANPLTLTLDDLQNNYETMDQYVTLSCISNRIGGDLISTTRWTGVSLQTILADARPEPGASHLRIEGADGFYETVALDLVNTDERVMLTTHWDGQPLQIKHGFPLRIYIPDRYGMKQPKWITEMEVIDGFRPGYWVARGWDEDAIVRATAVIDTIATRSTFGDDPVMVPIGGIAYAGARGISSVEVKVNDGDWEEAQLRTPLSDVTWVVWRFDWPLAEGSHTFYVRCTDGNGDPQITQENGPHPSGATGIHNIDMLI
jgi:DMSO/TMAO reductase YedYZ molybdopterin-dependent catalytic subunit